MNLLKKILRTKSLLGVSLWLILFFPIGLYVMWKNTQWNKKAKWVITVIYTLLVLGNGFSSNSTSPTQQAQQTTVQTTQAIQATTLPTVIATPTTVLTIVPSDTPIPTIFSNPTTNTQQPGLSNNNYYTNSSGNEVHSPAYSADNSVPAGATAKCGDGTYSFSQHRSGTCSHHGGVAEWY